MENCNKSNGTLTNFAESKWNKKIKVCPSVMEKISKVHQMILG